MKLVVAVTGASGVRYGVAAVRLLRDADVECHVVVTEAGRRVLKEETSYKVDDVHGMADRVHHPGDVGAEVASGSYDFDGALVCPCSMKTLGYVANGIAEGLVPRVADVCLKEGRRLVLVPRETPMARTHLENMVKAHDAGAVVAPASPGFYTGVDSLDEAVEVFAARLLDGFGVETPEMQRWTG